MNKKDITYWKSKVKEAYGRFKAYIYYDNFNMLLKAKLAEFDNDPLLNIIGLNPNVGFSILHVTENIFP